MCKRKFNLVLDENQIGALFIALTNNVASIDNADDNLLALPGMLYSLLNPTDGIALDGDMINDFTA